MATRKFNHRTPPSAEAIQIARRLNQPAHAKQERLAAIPRSVTRSNTPALAPTGGNALFHDHDTGATIPGLPPPLRCPFCGSADVGGIVENESENDRGPCSLYHVQCNHCGIIGPSAYSQAATASLWNIRHAAAADTSLVTQSVWSILDESNQAILKAKALLMTIKIALRNPDDQINEEDVQSSLGVLSELLDDVADGIGTAQSAVREVAA